MKHKFIVSGDQHIKVSKELPLEWQLYRFRALWEAYVALCKEHNAELVLCGDMFHNAKPNLYEVMLFLELLEVLRANCIRTNIIAGNHENLGTGGTTLDFFRPYFEGAEDYLRYHKCTWTKEIDHFEFVWVGHDKLDYWLNNVPPRDKSRTRVIFSHFRPTISEYIQEEIDVQKFCASGDYIFAGDIHTDCTFSKKLVYTNTPLNNHFEPSPKCGCLLVTCEAGKVDWERLSLELPNLVQVDTTAGQYDDIQDAYNYLRISVTGTPEELRKVKTANPNTKLLKIPELLETFAETVISEEVKNISLEDALIEYMKELGFSEETIQSMMEVYRGT